MKKALLAAGVLLALWTDAASAQSGINLSWTDCGVFGNAARTFACNTNSGVHTMVASVITGVDLPQLNGQYSTMEMTVSQATVPDWWQIGTGLCRPTTAIISDFSFVADVNCLDPWAGQAAGGLSYQPAYFSSNRSRIRTVCAIAGSTAITGVDEYYTFKLTFTNVRTVGLGSCAGCNVPACFVLTSTQVTQPAGVGDYTIANPISRNYVIWQGASETTCFTPVRTKTWGAVKAMYR